MGKQSHHRLLRFLPQVVVATFVVAFSPVLLVWALRASGLVESMILLVAVGTVLSLGLAWGGRALWERRPGSGDLLFGELMIWGWLRRWFIERRLARAMTLLGLGDSAQRADAASLSPERQTQLLEELANALEARDPYTHGHSRRVARHAAMIAKRMGLPRDRVAGVRTAAALHDVGKLGIPTEILHKPVRLTDEEFAVIKQHPARGAEMVGGLVDEELVSSILHHHERVDGTGYPGGISGAEIPLGARIIAVADTFDAITSTRPYRSAKPHKQALDILQKEAGTQLDAAPVRAFWSCYSGFRPLAFWVVLTHVPQRLFYPLLREVNAAVGGAASAAKVMAATAATAAVGSAAVGSSVAIEQLDPRSAQAAANGSVALSQLGQSGQLGALGDLPVARPLPSRSSDVPGDDAGATDSGGAPENRSGGSGSEPSTLPTPSTPDPVLSSDTSYEPPVTADDGLSSLPQEELSMDQDSGSSASYGSDPSGSSADEPGGDPAVEPSTGSGGEPSGDTGGGSAGKPGAGQGGKPDSGRGGGPNSGSGGGSSSGPSGKPGGSQSGRPDRVGGPDIAPGGGSNSGQGGGSSADRGGGSSGGQSGGSGGGSQSGKPDRDTVPGDGSNSGQGGGSSSDPSADLGTDPSSDLGTDPGSSLDGQGGGSNSGQGGGSSSGPGGGTSSGPGGGSSSGPGGGSSSGGGSGKPRPTR